MKPIEPGAIVLVMVVPIRAATVRCKDSTGFVCGRCGSREWWALDDGWTYSRCLLMRIDDDPDALTQPVEQEESA